MDDNAYKELIEEEWNDPSAVDCEDIREQLEIDKTNFSRFVVSGDPDDDDEEEEEEDDDDDDDDLELLAMELERSNIDDEDMEVDQIDPVDLNNYYNCCSHKCLEKLPAVDLRKYVVAIRKLKESEKRQLLHPLIACCVKVDSGRLRRKRNKQ